MIELNIPGRGIIQLEHLVSDVNGTLAVDGRLAPGVKGAFTRLGDRMELHLLTADTHGKGARIGQQLGLTATRIPPGSEAKAKRAFIEELGPDRVVALGQGANDALMLKKAAVGICLLSVEGTAVETLMAADLVAADILSALDLLDKPLRLVATLRR